jgi:flagellar motor switch/type III secretory pathway protein FliN
MAAAVSSEQAVGHTAAAVKAAEVKPPAIRQAETKLDDRKEQTEEERWQPVLNLPCELTVELPLPDFHVSDLLELQNGSVIGTQWHLTRDVPLRINGTLIGWSEFEVVGDRLAVRLTELV